MNKMGQFYLQGLNKCETVSSCIAWNLCSSTKAYSLTPCMISAEIAMAGFDWKLFSLSLQVFISSSFNICYWTLKVKVLCNEACPSVTPELMERSKGKREWCDGCLLPLV